MVPCVDILIQPDTDPGPVLEVAEDEVDGLHHHLLDLLAATVAHLISQVGPLQADKLRTIHSLTISVQVAVRVLPSQLAQDYNVSFVMC